MNIILNIVLFVTIILYTSGCQENNKKISEKFDNPFSDEIYTPKNSREKEIINNINNLSDALVNLAEKYKNSSFISIDEMYADAAIVAKAYKAYVDNRNGVPIHWNTCRAVYQDVSHSIYPKMKEIYPELAMIDADYYLQKKQESENTKNIDVQRLERIKNMAIVEYSARHWWSDYNDYLSIANQTFFQENPEKTDHSLD